MNFSGSLADKWISVTAIQHDERKAQKAWQGEDFVLLKIEHWLVLVKTAVKKFRRIRTTFSGN